MHAREGRIRPHRRRLCDRWSSERHRRNEGLTGGRWRRGPVWSQSLIDGRRRPRADLRIVDGRSYVVERRLCEVGAAATSTSCPRVGMLVQIAPCPRKGSRGLVRDRRGIGAVLRRLLRCRRRQRDEGVPFRDASVPGDLSRHRRHRESRRDHPRRRESVPVRKRLGIIRE